MEQLSVWVGTGLVTAGVSAALLAGAAVASADTGSGAASNDSASSTSTSSDAPRHETAPKPAVKPKSTSDGSDKDQPGSVKGTGEDAGAADTAGETPTKRTKPITKPTPSQPTTGSSDEPDSTAPDSTDPDSTHPDSTQPDTNEPDSSADQGDRPSKHTTSTTDTPSTTPVTANQPAGTPTAPKPATADADATTVASVEVTEPTNPVLATTTQVVPNQTVAREVSAKSIAGTSLVQTSLAAAAAPAAPSLLGIVQGLITAVFVNVGSVTITALQAIEALVTGPPVLPPGSTVTVRDSWITLDTGQRVAANWYFPKVVDDTPPTQMILLNHGLFALGPMYSYTAANLAEETYSIVVTPTLPSNPFLGDSAWLGGTAMANSIANLFVGPRTSLTQSALDAGYATQYGLDPTTATLPQKFALAGHSLGGNLVAAAAGFLAADSSGAARDLVGVIMLDGVPVGTTMDDALTKLATYEADSGHYVPIREIGAPWNLFNSLSNVNQSLTEFRPDHYNGVVLTGGVHMDSMRGGNPLIQFAAYLVAGFPQPQNPPAVDALSVQWLKEWFGGDPYVGDGTAPGTTIPIGAADGVVIGNLPVARLGRSVIFASTTPTTIPAVKPSLASLAA